MLKFIKNIFVLPTQLKPYLHLFWILITAYLFQAKELLNLAALLPSAIFLLVDQPAPYTSQGRLIYQLQPSILRENQPQLYVGKHLIKPVEDSLFHPENTLVMMI